MVEPKKEWRIVRIVDRYRVIINGGKADGLYKDETFVVLGEGIEIKDPENGKVLDILYKPKARMSVIHLEDHIAVLQNSKTEEKEEGFTTMYNIQPRKVSVISPLKVDDSSIEGGWESEPIKVGDKVVVPT
jgi:hypothetical protein